MAGIYIHIPFCVKRCAYCDFHKSLNLNDIPIMVDALVRELDQRATYLGHQEVRSIYFGGGTPSVLGMNQIIRIVDRIYERFRVATDVEITMEANPDDLHKDYLLALKESQVNRLSIGVQSFDNKELVVLNRRHNRSQALEAISDAQDLGLKNISIDLIYGLPSQTLDMWEKNLDVVETLGVSHLSSYHLIYEQGTEMYRWKQQKRIIPVHEETSVAMFKMLINRAEDMGFEHYEISNFAKDGLRSRHNSSYWNGDHYLGIGPSAHSFNGSERSWNVRNNKKYVDAVFAEESYSESEKLDATTRYNEYVITALRTKEGASLDLIKGRYGSILRTYFEDNSLRFVRNGELIRDKDQVYFSKEGVFLSDGIMSDLLWVNDDE